MADRDFLERIDAHMERGNEHMKRGNELMDQVREEVRLTREEIQHSREEFQLSREEIRLSREEARLSREQHADLRIFIRDINRRAERFTQEAIAELQRLSVGFEDVRQETRAQTQGLLRMIDRLGPSGSAA